MTGGGDFVWFVSIEPEPLDFGTVSESPTFSLCSGSLTSLWNAFGCSSDITLYLTLACNPVLYECMQNVLLHDTNKISKPTQFFEKNYTTLIKLKKFRANFEECHISFQVPVVERVYVSEVGILVLLLRGDYQFCTPGRQFYTDLSRRGNQFCDVEGEATINRKYFSLFDVN